MNRFTINKINIRAQIEYENMVKRCELHNANTTTIIRQATPEENEYYTQITEQAIKEYALNKKNKERIYTYE